MVTSQERMRVLEMLQEGKLTAEAAAQLLEAMGEGDAAASQAVESPESVWSTAQVGLAEGKKATWLRVRVTDTNSGRTRVNVRVPLALVNLGIKMGSRFAPEIEGLDMAALLQAVQAGETGPFVDVVDHEDGEHVEVFLE